MKKRLPSYTAAAAFICNSMAFFSVYFNPFVLFHKPHNFSEILHPCSSPYLLDNLCGAGRGKQHTLLMGKPLSQSREEA